MTTTTSRRSLRVAALLIVTIAMSLSSIRNVGKITEPNSLEYQWIPSATTNKTTIVGYAVSITDCNVNDTFMFDAAAVLHFSIQMATRPSSKYGFKMYAFLHQDAVDCAPRFSMLGYHVQIQESPVGMHHIKNIQLQRAASNGCCGFKEFMKLQSYMLEDVAVVVHFDLDVIVLKPMDHLFDLMLDSSLVSHGQVQPMWLQANQSFPEKVDFLFVRDYNLVDPPRRAPHQIGIQGGFLIVKPNQTDFRRMLEIIKSGGNFTNKDGWGGPHHKYGGYYGAATIQGFMPYYFGAFEAHRALELNRCAYNNMADNPRHQFSNMCRTLEDECEDCREKNLSEIYTAHFTVCYKPWTCATVARDDLCGKLHGEWHRIRFEMEKKWAAEYDDYYPTYSRNVKSPRAVNASFGHCKSTKVIGYIPMLFPNQKDSTPIL